MQKFKDNCNESINLGHTDTSTLKKGRDQYGKAKSIQVETLSTGYYFINREMVPTVQPKFP
ncbi:hypothetical protein COJ48_29200 [Bacillus cereus]|nr:hypothetical protein COJ48_29200 [Bacillus cereus]PGP89889.1 hypothetical protein CN997_00085 [Bacillus cereus]